MCFFLLKVFTRDDIRQGHGRFRRGIAPFPCGMGLSLYMAKPKVAVITSPRWAHCFVCQAAVRGSLELPLPVSFKILWILSPKTQEESWDIFSSRCLSILDSMLVLSITSLSGCSPKELKAAKMPPPAAFYLPKNDTKYVRLKQSNWSKIARWTW